MLFVYHPPNVQPAKSISKNILSNFCKKIWRTGFFATFAKPQQRLFKMRKILCSLIVMCLAAGTENESAGGSPAENREAPTPQPGTTQAPTQDAGAQSPNLQDGAPLPGANVDFDASSHEADPDDAD